VTIGYVEHVVQRSKNRAKSLKVATKQAVLLDSTSGKFEISRMKKIILFATATWFLTLTNCQTSTSRNPSEEGSKASKATEAEANLTKVEAESRFQQVKNPDYALELSLDATRDNFEGQSRISFELTAVPANLFLDFKSGATIKSLKVNDQTVEKPVFALHRILLPAGALHVGANHVEMIYSQNYSHEGRGLHRFQDPEDHRVYLYTQFEAYDAHQMFPCFDQPDMKAKFHLKVTAPESWVVVSTTRELKRKVMGEKTLWTFPETPLISTYLFSVHAGPYHVWHAEAGAIPLRLFARESLARFVVTKDWFTPTQQGLKFYGDYFAYPYPFKKYDQLIVPDFNAGAMENVAAVTFSERAIHRGATSRRDRESLASVILHEMAHMWFGDLVTMKWWDGLWLNESFATFMSALSQDKATEFKESWTTFYTNEKTWAYWQDQLVTTHPINGDVPDTDSAFSNFDGITYGKGASVLKQLNYFLGPDTFRDGVRYYFKTYAYSNTRLENFIGALEYSSKHTSQSSPESTNLSSWSDSWLRKAGLDSVRADFDCENQLITRFELELRGPDHGLSPRAHRTLVALYAKNEAGKIHAYKTAAVEYKGLKTPIAGFVGLSCPDLVYPNLDDQDYVKVKLDGRTLETVRTHLSAVPAAFVRTMIWPNLYEMVRDQELSPQDYLKIAMDGISKESDLKTLEQMIGKIPEVVFYLPESKPTQEAMVQNWVAKIEALEWQALTSAAAGSDWQKTYLASFTGVVETPMGQAHLIDLLEGKEILKGLTLDSDRRWTMIIRLASLLDVGQNKQFDKIMAEQSKRDLSERGVQNSMAAEAARPNLANKKSWFKKIVEQKEIPYSRARTALSIFLPRWQVELRAALADDFYSHLPQVAKEREAEFQTLYIRAFVPALCTVESENKLLEFVKAHPDLPPPMLKGLKVSQQEDARCVAVRNSAKSVQL
jgi:aminopeptidase N